MARLVKTIMGYFDRDRYEKLQRLYNQAKKNNRDGFTEVLSKERLTELCFDIDAEDGAIKWEMEFTKYMLEFLSSQFK